MVQTAYKQACKESVVVFLNEMQKQFSNDEKQRILANRYRIEKKLGSGNFGTAYLVIDQKNYDEEKVLKEVSVGDMQPDDTVESVHEANLLSKLDHPYIVKYHDSFLDGEYFCIVTEYCEGGDLDVRFKKLKKENKRLSETQILDWFIQLLSAIHYMHSRRVLHRDLKARNIFLKDEVIKIGDFGISRILIGTMDMATTFTGTPYYMSPEVLKHEGYNSKSDVWSLGCLLYEMCTFEHAFEGQGLMGVMYKIVEGKVPDLPSSYSRKLNNILKKIFSKDPNQRPSTGELLHEPYIAEHIKNMIERLSSGKTLNESESTLMVRNSTSDIAKAFNTKYHVKDLKTSSSSNTIPIIDNPIEDDTDETLDELNSLSSSSINSARRFADGNKSVNELTPKERLLLNKLKKADEEGKKLGLMAKENYEERMLRESFRREATIHSVPQTRFALPLGYPNIDMQTLQKTHQQYSPSSYESNTNHQDGSSDDEYEGTLLKTVQNFKKYEYQSNGKDPSGADLTATKTFTGASKTLKDDRPIQPMKSRIEKNSFDDDGIPIDPHLTNEYYKNYNFEEEDKSPERLNTKPNRSYQLRNSMSKTVLPPSHNKVAVSKHGKILPPLNKAKTELKIQSKTISGNKPRGSHAARSEYEQLINVLSNKSDCTSDLRRLN